jgi:hypothetical protein
VNKFARRKSEIAVGLSILIRQPLRIDSATPETESAIVENNSATAESYPAVVGEVPGSAAGCLV